MKEAILYIFVVALGCVVLLAIGAVTHYLTLPY